MKPSSKAWAGHHNVAADRVQCTPVCATESRQWCEGLLFPNPLADGSWACYQQQTGSITTCPQPTVLDKRCRGTTALLPRATHSVPSLWPLLDTSGAPQ
jgi:hypothetical protein